MVTFNGETSSRALPFGVLLQGIFKKLDLWYQISYYSTRTVQGSPNELLSVQTVVAFETEAAYTIK